MTYPQGYEDLAEEKERKRQREQQEQEEKKQDQTSATVAVNQQQQQSEPNEELENEYSEALEKQRVKMPKIHNIQKSLSFLVKNEKMEIKDVFFRHPQSDNIIATQILVTLHPQEDNCQIRPYKVEENEQAMANVRIQYTILAGRGTISISDFTNRIVMGDCFWVERGVKHAIVNNTHIGEKEAQDLVFTISYGGYIDFRDLYKSYSQKMKESKETMQNLFKGYDERSTIYRESSRETPIYHFQPRIPRTSREKEKQKQKGIKTTESSDNNFI